MKLLIIGLSVLISLAAHSASSLVIRLDGSVLKLNKLSFKEIINELDSLSEQELALNSEDWMGPYWERFTKSLSNPEGKHDVHLMYRYSQVDSVDMRRFIELLRDKNIIKRKALISSFRGSEQALVIRLANQLQAKSLTDGKNHLFSYVANSLADYFHVFEKVLMFRQRGASRKIDYVFSFSGRESFKGAVVKSHSVLLPEGSYARPLRGSEKLEYNKAYDIVVSSTGEGCIGTINKILRP